MAVRIGELLLKEKLITPEQLQSALNQQKANGGKLGYNLVKMGFVKDEQITALLSKQYGVPAISLAQFKIDPTIVKLVPTETARKYQMIPLSRSGGGIHAVVCGKHLWLDAPSVWCPGRTCWSKRQGA